MPCKIKHHFMIQPRHLFKKIDDSFSFATSLPNLKTSKLEHNFHHFKINLTSNFEFATSLPTLYLLNVDMGNLILEKEKLLRP